MGEVYALLVGIERYHDAGLPRLYGCRADIADAKGALAARTRRLNIMELYDDEATRVAIVNGFRTHLAQATSRDTAVFWFSGHGSFTRVPRELWHLEPDGRTMQTLVCADSRVDGRPDLLDKELGLLLDEVADSGCHVLVVLDSCHSQGATRGSDSRVRAATPSTLDTTGRVLANLVAHYARLPAGAPPHRHVTLSACRSFETAMEQPLDGTPRGVFSWALARALRRSPAGATYRELLALTRTEMEGVEASQRPQLEPATSGGQPILGGPAGPDRLMMRWGRDGWQVECGAAHGAAAGTRMTVADRGMGREVRLTGAATGHSLVEPIGWRPDRHRVYPVWVTAAPLAPVTVAGMPLPESPAVTVADDAELTIIPGPRLVDGDGTALHRWPPGTRATRIARDVAHIARWRQVWQLENFASTLRDQVHIELVGTRIRLRNHSARGLHCVLLALTDDFAISAALFPGATIAPYSVAAAAEGAPVEPRGGRTWLKLIVTTDDLDVTAYELPPIHEAWRDLRGVTTMPTSDWWATGLELPQP
ncbi:caspase family protein [Luedemannella helvata]|uniref:Peptidase C14 caspase domain-containing protein n=1 Tax=Luedemannella helvata TaxID=349315 RepID=A0ABN2JVM3_9ACTN